MDRIQEKSNRMTYPAETMAFQTSWCFPCVTQSDNSPALLTVLKEEGPVQSTLCFVCPDTVNMESDKEQKHQI